MKEMEDRILTQGEVLPGHILKVGNFLNQQIDSAFLSRIGEEIEIGRASCRERVSVDV